LRAYDPTTLSELYDSNQNAARDQLGVGVKFVTPTIADGQVFVGSSGALTIYGLLVTATTPPAAPTNLTASAPSSTAVTLNWVNNANNQSGFKIERSTGNTSNFAQIALAGANATSFVDTTVSANTLYYYRVRATNIVGDSAYSNNANATTPALAGVVELFHFDEGSGTTTADSAGGGNATLVGARPPRWTSPARVGTSALGFSGDGIPGTTASESAVQAANDLSGVLGSTSTLDVWVKTLQVGRATHQTSPAITGVDQLGGSNDIDWGTLDATGRIGIYVGDSGGVYSSARINDGSWHNIAMTRNASTGVVQLYVDGVLNGSGTFDTGNKTSQFFLIGALTDVAGDGVTVAGKNYFNGMLDEVRIYNQVLDAGSIASLAIVPTAPVLTSATAASGSVVQLAWTVPSNYTQNIEVDRKTGANGTYAAITTLAGNATSYMDSTVSAGVQYYYVIKAIDLAGTSKPSNAMSVTPPIPIVVGNYIFYNNSTFDGQNGSSNVTDDNAIATDKSALLPGHTATFSNYTSYSKGINGIIIDVANLEFVPRIDDFAFAVGNDNNVGAWTDAPSPTFVNTYPGRGPGGSTQITLIWDDDAIANEWLRVTMFAQTIGLAADDVFYFGNAIGETGDSASDAQVTSNDASRVNANQTGSASVTNIYDINRDGAVNSTDVSIVNSNLTTAANALKLIAVPAGPVVIPSEQAQWNSAADGSWNTSGNWMDPSSGTIVAAPGVRGVAGDTVLFSSASGNTARLDGASPSVAAITFSSSSAGFAISQGSGGVLHLANSGDGASITVTSGDHTVSAPVALDSNLTVLPTTDSQLTISGGISGAAALAVNDLGTVVLSGVNSYSGGTTVSAGTLIVTSASALATGSNLTIGSAASQFFAPTLPTAAAAVAPSAAGPTVASGSSIAKAAAAVTASGSPSASFPALLTSKAADLVHARLAAGGPSRIVAGLPWFGQAPSGSNNLDDHRGKDAALLALEAVFAQYGN
jgi:autotransporter-associated beta strand protein